MLSRLQLRLTAIFTLLTALVLSVAIGFAGSMAARQYRESAQALRETTFLAIQDRFETERKISDSWLTKQERDNRCILYIEDNGRPLAFSETAERTRLAERGKAALAAGERAAGQPGAFSMTDEAGERYQCMAVRLPTEEQEGILLMMFQATAAETQHLYGLVLTYTLVWLFSALALGCIGWGLVGLALQPTKKALQQQNEFVAAASHELRSPLTVIKTSLEAAQNAEVLSGESRQFLQIASGETERMRRLTEDLLLLAGQDANVWHSDLVPLELDTLCIELYEAYRLPARQKAHELTLQLPEARFPPVQGDAQRIDQLFAILLNNAMDYAPKGTPIELVAALKVHRVQVSVVDHGCGISEQAKQTIFDRFARGDKSRSDKAHFGLGLSVAKEIAQMHSAQLTVTDTPGGGATFTVSFPVRRT